MIPQLIPNAPIPLPFIGTVRKSDFHAARAKRDIAYSAWWLTNGAFTRARHVQYLSDQITPLLIAGGARIIVCAPPRHAKSSLISEHLPVWFLNRWAERKIIEACYGDTFASSWGEKVRDQIAGNPEKLTVRLKRGINGAMDQWETTAGGGMKTAGVGTGILGYGAHLFLIDDPIKDAAEAWSPTYQARLREWYQSTSSSRLEPGASVIVTMQRWPGDDFVSFLMRRNAEGRENWKLIRLPAVAEADDELGREVGEPLWPERYDRDALEAKRLSLEDEAYWLAQYQQRPPEASKEGLAYHAFDIDHSMADCEYDPDLPICWGLDFNVDPMCSVICQVEEEFSASSANWLTSKVIEPSSGKSIHVLDEICLPNSSTQAAAHEFIRRTQKWMRQGRRLEVIVYGDSSGHSRKTTAPADYRVIEEIFRADSRYLVSMRADIHNPAVRDRVTTVNNAFLNATGKRRLFVDHKCAELRKDLLHMRWRRDVVGNTTNELDESNKQRSHVSSALGYLVWGELKMRAKGGFMGGARLV